jgi:hypothetical protein
MGRHRKVEHITGDDDDVRVNVYSGLPDGVNLDGDERPMYEPMNRPKERRPASRSRRVPAPRS